MSSKIVTRELLKKMREEAEAGDAQAAYEVAEYYYGRREFAKAFEWYIKTAQCENPNPVVYFNIGYAFQNGEGTEVDLISAYDFYEKAAARHLPQALYNLAYFYQNGLVVKQDFAKAEEYSRQAARELDRLVTRLHEAGCREERMIEQLAEAKVKKNVWKMRAAECEKKIARLEAENRSMADLLIKAQYELEKHKA